MIAAKPLPVDPVAGVAEGIVDERIAKVLMEDDRLVVAMEFLAAANRAASLHEGLGVIGIADRTRSRRDADRAPACDLRVAFRNPFVVGALQISSAPPVPRHAPPVPPAFGPGRGAIRSENMSSVAACRRL